MILLNVETDEKRDLLSNSTTTLQAPLSSYNKSRRGPKVDLGG